MAKLLMYDSERDYHLGHNGIFIKEDSNIDKLINIAEEKIHRGLYKSKDGIIINADVNGSANIGRKCKQNFTIEELSSGLLASPKRIRVV